MKIRRALLSVSDKTGLVDFARGLADAGVELLSTGGTASALRAAGLTVKDVSEHTGFPEILDGRVKTLHPMIHGGLLFRRDKPEHTKQAQEHGIAPIDLVVVNLYPFGETVAREGVTLEEAIENIDIGGPSMLRSAAKNAAAVTVICDPDDYGDVLESMKENGGATTLKLRERLAVKVFDLTARYDRAIANYLQSGQRTRASFTCSQPLAARLRYGENPHQEAELYGNFSDHLEQLHGKELSYNNILDITAAVDLIGEFDAPTVAILKHTNPCGVGSDDDDLCAAWEKAFATDRQAPFGGIIICNRPLTAPLASAIAEIFSEVIIAPDFEPEARALLQKKKNLRLMLLRGLPQPAPRDVRSVIGGVLVQDHDASSEKPEASQVVTARPPTQSELRAMEFGWKVVKHVKSNAIVFAGPDRTLGIGAGQMSRVDSVRIAVWKAGEAGLSLRGSAVASDAFFPFPDGLVSAAEAGAVACIQPGGSVRDAEVIAAADARKMAMVFTGKRHFRH
ncbi:MAG: bifunctional phosphoribosylaminoimidazolecarboxamide formyltransferase/IMP cyclohydrolase [Chthoniobacterales bacterium]|nr:bifunctional phosphoribosylaminoimidazolecarboxamide formyltransferase/IMP cyclohydrolase [Chthoniobacterales bacterium]